MKRRIVQIAPWQAGKISAVMYFVIGIFIAIPMAVFSQLMPGAAGAAPYGIAFFIALPFLYAIVGLLFVPLTCWFYNVAAKVVGGLSLTVEDDTRS